MLKLKLQYLGHLMQRADSLEKTLMLGKIEGRRRRWWQRVRWLDGITNSMDMSLSKLQELWWIGRPGVLQSMGLQRVGHNWATELNQTNVGQKNDQHLGWENPVCTRFFHTPQSSVEFKICDSFISKLFYLNFWDHSWPGVTETTESKTWDEGRCSLSFSIFEK